METYTIALKPSVMDKVRKAAAKDDINVRLWIREAITMTLEVQEEIDERKRQLEHSQESA